MRIEQKQNKTHVDDSPLSCSSAAAIAELRNALNSHSNEIVVWFKLIEQKPNALL
jgi:hypothetical protein